MFEGNPNVSTEKSLQELVYDLSSLNVISNRLSVVFHNNIVRGINKCYKVHKLILFIFYKILPKTYFFIGDELYFNLISLFTLFLKNISKHQKNIRAHHFCFVYHDLKYDVSHDRGTFNVLDMTPITPI